MQMGIQLYGDARPPEGVVGSAVHPVAQKNGRRGQCGKNAGRNMPQPLPDAGGESKGAAQQQGREAREIGCQRGERDEGEVPSGVHFRYTPARKAASAPATTAPDVLNQR